MADSFLKTYKAPLKYYPSEISELENISNIAKAKTNSLTVKENHIPAAVIKDIYLIADKKIK